MSLAFSPIFTQELSRLRKHIAVTYCLFNFNLVVGKCLTELTHELIESGLIFDVTMSIQLKKL